MGFIGFILVLFGLAAFILTMGFCWMSGDPREKTGKDVVAAILCFGFAAIVLIFSAGYCLG